MKMGDALIHSRTPVEGPGKPYVINDSSINTNSSRNIFRWLLPRTAEAKKKQKLAGAKKEKKPAKAKKEKKPAKAKKEKKPAKAKNKPEKHVSSDSDWLITEEQLTDNEKENLFEDAASPELVREDHIIHEYKFGSPVRQRHKYALSPIRVKGDGEKIPVKDLKHLRTVFDSSDEEEELLPRRSDPVRTGPGVAHSRKKKPEINIDKSKRSIVDLKIHTTAADMLLDVYVGEHPEEMRESIGPPAEQRKVFRFFRSKNKDSNKSDKGKATKKEDWRTKKTIVKDPFEFPVHKDNAVENFTYSEYKRISASSTEFQRHDDLCSYATREQREKERAR
ncbi:uncharacterized protein LOC143217835 isoform X2 [Lasioglossum baleicum]|uniref:uncharacterized protein LOC143217835 isoform X2 n=1 Tax=Lasioglossum baleicum TaxID=434251 RepID=UPI003FCC30A2